jgi:transcriptional regulator with XRE-family HTH domain
MAKHQYPFPETITQLAKKCGVSRNYLSLVLARRVPIRPWLARVIEVETDGKIKASSFKNTKNENFKHLVFFGVEEDGSPYLGLRKHLLDDEKLKTLKPGQKVDLFSLWCLYAENPSFPPSKEEIFKLLDEKCRMHSEDTNFFEDFFKFKNGKWTPKYAKKQVVQR